MFTNRRMLKVLKELEKHDALLCAVWDYRGELRIWLRGWCRIRSSVSVGTAEQILEEIVAGNLSPSEVPLKPSESVRRKHRPKHAQKLIEYVETSFVEAGT